MIVVCQKYIKDDKWQVSIAPAYPSSFKPAGASGIGGCATECLPHATVATVQYSMYSVTLWDIEKRTSRFKVAYAERDGTHGFILYDFSIQSLLLFGNNG
jgi:hypothetical protein